MRISRKERRDNLSAAVPQMPEQGGKRGMRRVFGRWIVAAVTALTSCACPKNEAPWSGSENPAETAAALNGQLMKATGCYLRYRTLGNVVDVQISPEEQEEILGILRQARTTDSHERIRILYAARGWTHGVVLTGSGECGEVERQQFKIEGQAGAGLFTLTEPQYRRLWYELVSTHAPYNR